MAKKYDKMSEEELVKILDLGIESQEQLAEILTAMQAKGMSGGLISFAGDDPEEFEVTSEYINFHDQVKEPADPKDTQKALKVIKNKNTDSAGLKIAIITLAHTGEIKPLEALQKFEKTAKDELKLWAKIAIDECKMFLESKLLDQPRIKITTIEKK